MTAALEIDGLTKEFAVNLRGRRLRAVDNVSLRVEAGQVFGLLGPNGSGKSTTLKLMLGLLAPTAGSCRIFGRDSRNTEARRDVGYLPESPYFYRYLSGFELVKFYARICDVSARQLDGRVREAIAWVGLAGAADRRVGTYSKGMLQRIGLAQALVHDPRLVILDEPTAGVDPVGVAEISRLIRKLKARGKTVLVCSHLLGQVEEICDQVAILNQGRLILSGRLEDLTGGPDGAAQLVENLSAGQLAELRVWLAERSGRLTATELPRTRLDRLFLEKIGAAAAGSWEDGR